MDKQSTEKFTWVINNFSELKEEARSSRFTIGGCYWRLLAYVQGEHAEQNRLGVYLEVSNSKPLPSQWKRHVRCIASVVNQSSKSDNLYNIGESWFSENAKSWGCPSFMRLTQLKSPTNGFLMNDSVIIEAKIEVLEVYGDLDVTPEEVDAEETSSDESEEESIDCEETSSDESEEESIDCSSPPSVDAEEFEICKEVSTSKNPQEPLEAYEIVEADVANSDVAATNVCTSKNPQEPLEAYETVEADAAKSDDAVTDVCTSNNSSAKTELIFQTTDINGFLVHDTQLEQVKRIFKRHPDLASNFRPKNQKLRTTYVNVLLDLIEELSRSPQDITEDDLIKGSNTLVDLEDVGLGLDWLKAKFDEVKKRKERAGGARIGELEKQFEKLKLMMCDVKAELEKEKEVVAAARVPLSFNDLVS